MEASGIVVAGNAEESKSGLVVNAWHRKPLKSCPSIPCPPFRSVGQVDRGHGSQSRILLRFCFFVYSNYSTSRASKRVGDPNEVHFATQFRM